MEDSRTRGRRRRNPSPVHRKFRCRERRPTLGRRPPLDFSLTSPHSATGGCLAHKFHVLLKQGRDRQRPLAPIQQGKEQAAVGEETRFQTMSKQPISNRMVRPFHLVSRIERYSTQTTRPSVPVNVQNAVLSRLIFSLEGVAAHHSSRSAHARGEKRQRKDQQTGPNKRRKTPSGSEGDISDPITTSVGSPSAPDEPMDIQTTDQETVTPTAPPIIPHLIMGINRVTRRLEGQARAYRQTLTATKTITDDGTSQPPPSGPISVVFVCRADVDPPLLISHLPTLIASCNSSRKALTDPNSYPPIKLVPVPKGSESLLAEATGLRRLAVLA